MMIKIVGIQSIEYTVLSVDPYIPFDFSTDPRITPNPFMWRTGDLDSKMFEIAIDPESHLLKYATLVSYTDTIYKGRTPEKPTNHLEGVPVIDVTIFTERIIDSMGDCLLLRYDNSYILFINPTISLNDYTCIQCGRAGFFCDKEGFLQAVEFSDLSVQEQSTLTQSLRYAE